MARAGQDRRRGAGGGVALDLEQDREEEGETRERHDVSWADIRPVGRIGGSLRVGERRGPHPTSVAIHRRGPRAAFPPRSRGAESCDARRAPSLRPAVDAEPPASGPLSPPLVRATTFGQPDRQAQLRAAVAFDGRFYPRYGHEIGRRCEGAIAALERAEGSLLFASGMAALTAVFLGLLRAGDRVAVAHAVYGGTALLADELLPRVGIEVLRFDPFDPDALAGVLAGRPRLVHVESPVNPTLRVLDLAALARAIHAAGALLSVDATFVPPPFQRPLALGVDVVVHSATKALGGHSDVLAGVVSGRDAELRAVERHRRLGGAVLGQDAAWLLHRSLATLEMRFERQSRSATTICRVLAAIRDELGIERLWHPSLPEHPDRALVDATLAAPGGVLSVEPRGGLARAAAVYDRLRRFHRSPSLAGTESLVCLPIDTSHAGWSEARLEAAGFGAGLLRLSAGLEDPEALADDLVQALSATI
ncbi:MAG: PLP-dependent aspartate aminotransferase family protein [Planctomycetota bacterium]